jgi:ABC-type multidrug transport system fused ATPase/permease subunit
VKLLSRLYEPTGGRITADGTPLAEFDSRSWQKRMAVIYQDYVRYELDASAEHDLFERYATSAGQAAQEHGGITVLISHRFSTVGMADTIAALKDGRLAESGTHRELMDDGALYAELFTLQARAYRLSRSGAYQPRDGVCGRAASPLRMVEPGEALD